MNIAENSYVALDYCLTLESGEEIDKSQEGQPLSFITGTSQIIPGLEKALMGMAVGDSAKVDVAPEEAYGLVNDDLFQEVPRDQFPADVVLEPGMTFQAQGPQGPFMLEISKLMEDAVEINLNHPLAGKKLFFDVKIVEVREATETELAQAASSGCGCGCDSDSDSGCGCGSDSGSGQCGSGCNCG